MTTAASQDSTTRALIFVRGRVQGVGFRWWTRARAMELGLAGHARNMPDGRVEVNAQGAQADVERLIERLQEQPSSRSRPGHVAGVSVQWHHPKDGIDDFVER
ncbi:MAG: acylphosphatase [Ornithinimicrobium sp.]|uniref:acylphosphatase n=1 Tax=Ornithinimicrobium sp. TaxID=1977084 RepID=UPI003D9B58DC